MYRRSERCDDIVSASHKLLFKLVKFGEMPLFERGYGREAIVDGDSGEVSHALGALDMLKSAMH